MVIKFKTENERLEHPQAKLIPAALWYANECNRQLEECYLPLMTTESVEELKNLVNTSTVLKNKKMAWMCIAVSHKQLDFDTLKAFAVDLGINSFDLFGLLVILGSLPLIKEFQKQINPELFHDYITKHYFKLDEDEFNALDVSIYTGRQDILDYFVSIVTAVSFYSGDRISLAILGGHVEMLKYLQSDMFDAGRWNQLFSNPWAFYHYAAKRGHLPMLMHLEQIPPEFKEVQEIEGISTYSSAIKSGDLKMLQHIEERVPNLLEEITKPSSHFCASHVNCAAEYGHVHVLEYFINKIPSLMDMIVSADFIPYQTAITYGHVEVLEFIEKKVQHEIANLLKTKGVEYYKLAFINGHVQALIHLESKAPDMAQSMIDAIDTESIIRAVRSGKLEVLKYLQQKIPLEKMQSLMTGVGSNEYVYIFKDNHLELLLFLKQLRPVSVNNYLSGEFDILYKKAAEKGHLRLIKYLETEYPDKIQDSMQADNFQVFQRARWDLSLEVCEHLLEISNPCFAYAEKHTVEYGSFVVNAFILKNLQRLHEQSQSIGTDELFNVSSEPEAIRCFYILRNLIRRNDASVNDEIRFLLRIPAVAEIAHQAITPENTNELVRLAISIGNVGARELLMELPEVQRLAQENNYYVNENRGNLDLRRLAQDHESAMTALTQGEEKRLSAAKAYYDPLIQAEGVPAIMERLRNDLRARYEKQPHSLPLEYKDFEALKLTGEERKKALETYYQDKIHTAYRYLSIPNHWMNPNASYVYINEERTERWAMFDGYQHEIALLYLAAADKNAKPLDGQTHESRVLNFFYELANTGRTHNWDKSRLREITDKEGNKRTIREEYDDLEGDKPTCFSGVKRRLFQSVLGHELFKILTEEMLLEEIKDFVKQRFKAKIVLLDKDNLLDAYMAFIIHTDEAKLDCLENLNITTGEIAEFKQMLGKKYKTQFTEDTAFKHYLDDKFELNASSEHAIDRYHVLKFAGIVQFDELVKDNSLQKFVGKTIKDIQLQLGTRVKKYDVGVKNKVEKLQAIFDWLQINPVTAENKIAILALVRDVCAIKRNRVGLFKPHSLQDFNRGFAGKLEGIPTGIYSRKELNGLKKLDDVNKIINEYTSRLGLGPT